mmetsp:Transcript_4261/g.8154  ORF Transcript_4261/g.8154 Transcript_4261/m.8154 type:complete len:551 (-) Transcript_4261:15-1667(-)
MLCLRCSTILIALSFYLSLQLSPSACFALQASRQPLAKLIQIKRYSNSVAATTKETSFGDLRGGSSVLKATNNENEISSTSPPPQPTLTDLFNFALPCLGLWISGPLLSLVDTASVGLTAKPGLGAFELGALGPATTFIDGSTYLFAFLNVATTNLYASALAKNAGNPEKAKRATDAVVRTAAKIALICGFGIMALLFLKGQFLLSLYVGDASKHILGPATEYVHIRALSMPTSLLAGVLQASLLGAKDSVTPLVAVLASTLVNVFGDGLLVVFMKWGTAGAAIATTLAQWAGTGALWGPARSKLLTKSTPQERAEYKVTSKVFLRFAAPVLTLILGKIAAFGMMTHVAAALPGEAALASHQLVLSLFFFLSPFLEVISQTAQTFLPQYYVENSEEFLKEAQSLAARLLKLGVSIGGVIALLAASIPRFFPFILTNDPLVQASVKPLALPLFLGGLLTAPVAVSEGVLLARRELKYLACVYMLSTIAFPFGLFKLKYSGGPVSNVWFGFVFFQMFRAACFTGKLWGRPVLRSIAAKLGLSQTTAVAKANS